MWLINLLVKGTHTLPNGVMQTAAILLLFCFAGLGSNAQSQQMVRIAKIKVNPAMLEPYKAALQEQMETAIKLEPGVLSYYAVADKKDPSNITILEVYADAAAYQLHIATPHFKKYKDAVQYMVVGLELIDVEPVGIAKKAGM